MIKKNDSSISETDNVDPHSDEFSEHTEISSSMKNFMQATATCPSPIGALLPPIGVPLGNIKIPLRPSYGTSDNLTHNYRVPSKPFSYLVCRSNTYPFAEFHWQQSKTNTLFIGDGDLTAVLLAFVGPYDLSIKKRFFLGEESDHHYSVLFFINSPVFPYSDFTNKLYQLNTVNGKREPNYKFEKDIIYSSQIQTYQYHGGVDLFQWVIFPDDSSSKPWKRFFLNDLKRLEPQPELIFCDGCCNYISQFFKRDITELKDWLTQVKSLGKGVVLTAPLHLKTKSFYDLFDQVIEFKLWRKQKCGNRNLVATLRKVHGEYLKTPIKYHIRPSTDNQIKWEEVGKRYDSYRSIISEGFRIGMTAKQMKELLNTRYEVTISLPMLAKLKHDWGLHTYKRLKDPKKNSC